MNTRPYLEAILLSIGSLLALGIIGGTLRTTLPTTPLTQVLTLLTGQLLAFGTIAYIYTTKINPNHPTIKQLYTTNTIPIKPTILTLTALLTINIGGTLLLPILFETTPTNTLTNNLTPPTLTLLALGSILIIGPLEELIYRGLIQKRLNQTTNTQNAIIITSILFAIAHLNPTQQTPIIALTLTITLTSSLILGYTYEYTNNLPANALIHGTHNAIIILLPLILS